MSRMLPRDRTETGRRARSLGEACRDAGLDDDGERCETCPLQHLCKNETRWLVCRSERPRYLN
jgi:hypothetical protein